VSRVLSREHNPASPHTRIWLYEGGSVIYSEIVDSVATDLTGLPAAQSELSVRIGGETRAKYMWDSATYDEWGMANPDYTSAGFVLQPASTPDDARFTGKDFESLTGLYYFNARWYDPQLRRFISEDPIRDGVNWYVYAGNNPLRFVDPSGLEPVTLTLGTGTVVGLGAAATWLFLMATSEDFRDANVAFGEFVGESVGRLAGGIRKLFASDETQAGEGSSDAEAASASNVDVKVRPEGVPEDWIETETEDGGRKWTNPNNPYDWVRSSPAKPDSPQPGQRYPNVKRHTPGATQTGRGTMLEKRLRRHTSRMKISTSSHISDEQC
jgi:RHS repeat-associated protein